MPANGRLDLIRRLNGYTLARNHYDGYCVDRAHKETAVNL